MKKADLMAALIGSIESCEVGEAGMVLAYLNGSILGAADCGDKDAGRINAAIFAKAPYLTLAFKK